MKISIITAVFNGGKYLEDCIGSISSQTYQDIEYIVVNGNSTDSTSAIIAKYRGKVTTLISEPDLGLYDAINKGLKVATGEVVGLLNSDDTLADENVVARIAEVFINNPEIDGTYGDLDYIDSETGKILRRWRSKQIGWTDLKRGWMPAHPTLYLRRSILQKYGDYSLNFGTAGDYEFILRYLFTYKVVCRYLPFLMVKMRQGGLSNQSIGSRISALQNDYKALIVNKIPFSLYVLLRKKLLKLGQYFR